jgi:hypothetical protein
MKDLGLRKSDQGLSIQHQGLSIQDKGFKISDQGFWITVYEDFQGFSSVMSQQELTNIIRDYQGTWNIDQIITWLNDHAQMSTDKAIGIRDLDDLGLRNYALGLGINDQDSLLKN